MRRLRSRLALVMPPVFLALLLPQTTAQAATCTNPGADQHCHYYAQTLSVSRNGVDGYLRGTALSGMGTNRGFVLWVGKAQFPGGEADGWAQIGQGQGNWTFTDPSGSTYNRVEPYWENLGPCKYVVDNFGVPSTANRAYHVTRSTAGMSLGCQDGRYFTGVLQYFYREGSWTNAPIAVGWSLPTDPCTHQASFEVAVAAGGVLPGVNPQYFGLNNSGQLSASHAPHVY